MPLFDQLLRRQGPWLGAFDFPFGLPREFVASQRLGDTMDAVIQAMHQRCGNRMDMRAMVDAWTANRPSGSKLLHRLTDRTASGVASTSPLQTRYVPVGWMYFEGVKRLVETDVTVPRMRQGRADAVALEGYPGLLAHQLVGRRSYKNKDDASRQEARLAIVSALERGESGLGRQLALTSNLREAVLMDATGDQLDAVLCLVQAAWASLQPDHGFSESVDPVEGWIVTS